MNSNSKFQELQEEQRVLVQKINYTIRNYKLRRLCASDDLADVVRIRSQNSDNYDMLPVWDARIFQLREEIEFCNRQIKAYAENDNKMKIIPDRLL